MIMTILHFIRLFGYGVCGGGIEVLLFWVKQAHAWGNITNHQDLGRDAIAELFKFRKALFEKNIVYTAIITSTVYILLFCWIDCRKLE